MTSDLLKIAGMIRKKKDNAAVYPWCLESDLAYIAKARTTTYTGSGVQHNRRMYEKRIIAAGLGHLLEQPE